MFIEGMVRRIRHGEKDEVEEKWSIFTSRS